MIDTQQAEMEVMQDAAKLLDEKLIDEWVKQGHHLTGGWERSLKHTVVVLGEYTQAEGTMNLYGVFINTGVHPDRIPYGGNSTGATTSKYIQGLYNFWLLRGLGEKQALRAAFATAKKQKVEGMPTGDSYRFSETGQRTQFIEIVDNVASTEVNDFICTGLDNIVDNKFHETASETI